MRLPESSGCYVVNCLNNAEQCGVGANGHVRSTEVVVNRADNANNVQVGTLVGIFRTNPVC